MTDKEKEVYSDLYSLGSLLDGATLDLLSLSKRMKRPDLTGLFHTLTHVKDRIEGLYDTCDYEVKP